MFKYKDFGFIKTITNFNEVIDEDEWTHFHWICDRNYNNLKVIKYCVENGADLNIKSIYESTPFHWICNRNTTKKVLEYCLENSADLTTKNIYESTPFYYICHYNKNLISSCKPYMDEYDFIKSLKECEIDWKEYV